MSSEEKDEHARLRDDMAEVRPMAVRSAQMCAQLTYSNGKRLESCVYLPAFVNGLAAWMARRTIDKVLREGVWVPGEPEKPNQSSSR